MKSGLDQDNHLALDLGLDLPFPGGTFPLYE